MSHVIALETRFRSLQALEQACKDMGLEIAWGQTTHRWYGRWVNDFHGEGAAYKRGIDPKTYGTCEHAIRIPGDAKAYEIGIVKAPDGDGYVLVYDFWGGGYGMEAKVGGKECQLLQAKYNQYAFMEQALHEGYVSPIVTEDEENIYVVAEDYNT